MKTKDPSSYKEEDEKSVYEYKAVLKTTNTEEVDIVQSFKIELTKNPNIYKASLANRKIYTDPSELK